MKYLDVRKIISVNALVIDNVIIEFGTANL